MGSPACWPGPAPGSWRPAPPAGGAWAQARRRRQRHQQKLQRVAGAEEARQPARRLPSWVGDTRCKQAPKNSASPHIVPAGWHTRQPTRAGQPAGWTHPHPHTAPHNTPTPAAPPTPTHTHKPQPTFILEMSALASSILCRPLRMEAASSRLYASFLQGRKAGGTTTVDGGSGPEVAAEGGPRQEAQNASCDWGGGSQASYSHHRQYSEAHTRTATPGRSLTWCTAACSR